MRGIPAEVVRHFQSVPLFAQVSKRGIRSVIQAATEMDVAAGKDLVRQGERGRHLFVILWGTATVIRDGRRVAELGPGDFFGELALLIDAPRNATVTALTPMEAIVLSRKEFDAALADAPRMTRKIMKGMATRLAEFDSKV